MLAIQDLCPSPVDLVSKTGKGNNAFIDVDDIMRLRNRSDVSFILRDNVIFMILKIKHMLVVSAGTVCSTNSWKNLSVLQPD